MEQVIRSILIVAFAFTGLSVVACKYPGEPEFSVPDGSAATKDEMIATQGHVKSYVSNVETYLACLDANLSAVDESEESSAEQRAIYELRYNAAVDSMELVADQFNNALRAYKDAQ